MYTLLKSPAYFISLLLLGVVIVGQSHFPVSNSKAKYKTVFAPPDCVYPDSLIILVIGQDRSQSFPGRNIAEEELKTMCQAIADLGNGGRIYLGIIGNRPPIKYEFCELEGIPKAPNGATISTVAACKQKEKDIKEKNTKTIETFIAKSKSLLNTSPSPITDLDGFLVFSKQLLEAPGTDKYHKWFYINSDGVHSLKLDQKTKMNCQKMPSAKNLHYYISGWDAKFEKCAPKGEFVDPAQFTVFFKKQMENLKKTIDNSKSKK